MNTESRRVFPKLAHVADARPMLFAMSTFAFLMGFIGNAGAEGLAPLGVHESGRLAFEAPRNDADVLSGLLIVSDGSQLLAVSPECVKASNPHVKNHADALRWYGGNADGYQSLTALDAQPDQ
jgi:hypothetical protein